MKLKETLYKPKVSGVTTKNAVLIATYQKKPFLCFKMKVHLYLIYQRLCELKYRALHCSKNTLVRLAQTITILLFPSPIKSSITR